MCRRCKPHHGTSHRRGEPGDRQDAGFGPGTGAIATSSYPPRRLAAFKPVILFSGHVAHGAQSRAGLRRRVALGLAREARAGSLEHFRAKWTPVRVKKMRQNKDMEYFRDSEKRENALGRTRRL
ncbi:hypothetical protein CHELA40_12278 [Chelatococcus asaccharovorans]|nr:hypothetical protein CHELA40_12278 [Chelatococcus asaccharovorans]CAH1683099.1 hypothetical protein CHELA17_63330 [Chelatococcus asaccharovorans]